MVRQTCPQACEEETRAQAEFEASHLSTGVWGGRWCMGKAWQDEGQG